MKAERKQFIKNTQDCIIRPLLRQRETGELCDVILKLNGRHFNAHKAILSIWSPYFLSMFTCDMREKCTKDIDLTESLVLDNDDILGVILDYMYTGRVTITVGNVEDIVRIADFLLLDDVKIYCQQFYLDLGNVDMSNCLCIRFLAESHNLPGVLAHCKKMIQARFHDYLIYHDEILDLPLSCLLQLLQDPDVVQHTNIGDLKRLVQRWVDNDTGQRKCFATDLQSCIKFWSGERSPHDTLITAKDEATVYEELCSETYVFEPEAQIATTEVLFAVVFNQALCFLKMLVYDIGPQKWYQFPILGEKITNAIPPRQTVCNMMTYKQQLYMYLCSSFPHPTNMLKINILVFDLFHGQPTLYSFCTLDSYNSSYKTTLTNNISVPPVMVMCADGLYVIGNKEGAGHLLLCNLLSHNYSCFQIPGSRFISLSRAIVKNDRHIYMWFRHRTGPSEEFCVKKSVGFAIFDTSTKVFNAWEVLPPEITYDSFADTYVMCVRDETVLIYLPGKPTFVLDEVRCRWVTSLKKLPSPSLTPDASNDRDVLSNGSLLLTPTEHSIMMLTSHAPFTSTMCEISETFPTAVSHKPPPIDQVSMLTAGHLPLVTLQCLERVDRYDEAYTTAIHIRMRLSEYETEDSAASNSECQDSDNEFEYDEEIYHYSYDLDFEYGF